MKKDWVTAKELIGIAGLPSSPQGVNAKARRERWEKRLREGVQGKAVEYYVNSLPESVVNVLQLKEDPANYVSKPQGTWAVWEEAYRQLTETEREKLAAFILREGIRKLVAHLAMI